MTPRRPARNEAVRHEALVILGELANDHLPDGDRQEISFEVGVIRQPVLKEKLSLLVEHT
jgi:hypothetical protein